MSKLEKTMDRRSAAYKKLVADSGAAQKKRDATARRQARLHERKEFNARFKKLRGMVKGSWDRNGYGWRFSYKGGNFYIKFEHWVHEKYAGDVDDYRSEGDHWVLKLGFNGMQGRTITLEYGERSGDLTEEVMDGLSELGHKFADRQGKFHNDGWGGENADD